MISMRNLASAVGGKTARACDSCIKKRARWYCAADDAFLCQACDSSVHSANLLAGKHERVRLKTASTEPADSVEPLWHRGFKTKPRTPRKSKLKSVHKNPFHLVVPELGQDENYLEENDEHEQLLYQVPILETFTDQLCLTKRAGSEGKKRVGTDEDGKNLSGIGVYDSPRDKDVNSLCGFSTETNMDIEEFAADVENLFGKGLDENSFDMETLGFLDCQEKYSHESCTSIETVKVEEEETRESNMGDIVEIDITGETFELNFDHDYEYPGNCEEDIKAEGNGVAEKEEFNDDFKVKKKNILLALDYESVISAWADKKTPWMTGDGRPELDLTECWWDCMDDYGRDIYGGRNNNIPAAAVARTDNEREARVLRYREKRRRRLFSKKIRYEVRKLNAEKRPRIKGRFVRRPTNMAPNS